MWKASQSVVLISDVRISEWMTKKARKTCWKKTSGEKKNNCKLEQKILIGELEKGIYYSLDGKGSWETGFIVKNPIKYKCPSIFLK